MLCFVAYSLRAQSRLVGARSGRLGALLRVPRPAASSFTYAEHPGSLISLWLGLFARIGDPSQQWARRALFYCLVLAIAPIAVGAQETLSPKLGQVWNEQTIGNQERGGQQTGRALMKMPANLYKFDERGYESIASRVRLRLPALTTDEVVSVLESVISRRLDGSPITSHLIFVPGNFAGPTADNQALSALVVTRLRDDRPKDATSVLASWEPSTSAQREQMERAGMRQTRIKTELFGETIQRVIRNRASVEPFPYQLKTLRSQKLETVGVTRLGVIGEDSLLEFSQVVPCQTLGEEECVGRALQLADAFLKGVSQFLKYPKQ